MTSESVKNPFSGLFESAQETPHNNPGSSEDTTKSSSGELDEKQKILLNQKYEEIFLITLNIESSTNRPNYLVFLPDIYASLNGQAWLDEESLREAVFERLMLTDVSENVVTAREPVVSRDDREASEPNVLKYLLQCYIRLQNISRRQQNDEQSAMKEVKDVIIEFAKMCFQLPDIFPNEPNVQKFFIESYFYYNGSNNSADMQEFLKAVFDAFDKESEDADVINIIRPVLDDLKIRLSKLVKSVSSSEIYSYIDLLLFFSQKASLAEILVSHITPQTSPENGKSYEDSLVGMILSISCISVKEKGPHEFFDSPARYSKRDHDLTEQSIHQPLAALNEKMHQLFYNLLKISPISKEKLLLWIGGCLHANKGRAKIWSNQALPPEMFGAMFCSDGFFLNLCAVLLRLSGPFAKANSPKLLKIQPTYCLATADGKGQVYNVHMKDISDETGMVALPEAEAERLKVEETYNFLSECFHMTHYALKLGFYVVHERFLKLNQELNRIQNAYQDIARAGAENTDVGLKIKDQMEQRMTVFLCLKAALVEPKLLNLSFNFHVATATYLVHMATSGQRTKFEELEFPLVKKVPVEMSYIPEFIAENTMDYLLFLRRFKDSVYEEQGEKLDFIMTFIMVFMGSPDRMRNPHLRANMAEALEALMPPKGNNTSSFLGLSFLRERLFTSHPHINELARTLLHVFVSIEMTGQGVQFEQKFNYRRPMYAVLEYMWDKENHRQAIQQLAAYAEEHIEDTDPPLFLRFINLLVNDAIFLLDEALQYMSQIKEKQEEKERGDWEKLDQRARQQTESNFQHLRSLARFHNLMGRETIHTLVLLTLEIKSIFIHNVMCDRVASMLNYFLTHLVGPKQKELKVKNFEEFEFKPHELVVNIVQIYLNLGEADEFCLAVSRDGRSYSHQLFLKTVKVLQKVDKPRMDMVPEFSELSIKIKGIGSSVQEEEDALADAPEEFLDPIMGTFMKEPVMLPTSGKIIDRPTIARHILSDQTDPFNRQPLTMEMLEPATELKQRMDKWLAEKGITL